MDPRSNVYLRFASFSFPGSGLISIIFFFCVLPVLFVCVGLADSVEATRNVGGGDGDGGGAWAAERSPSILFILSVSLSLSLSAPTTELSEALRSRADRSMAAAAAAEEEAASASASVPSREVPRRPRRIRRLHF